MNLKPSQPDRTGGSANPAVRFLAPAAVAVLAWSTGFFMAGRTSSTQTSTDAGARSSERTGASREVREISSNTRSDRLDSRTSPLEALLDAMQQSDEIRRIGLVSSAVENLGREDIQAALEVVLSRGDFDRGAILPQIVSRWAEFDPKAAAAYALGLREGRSPWFIGSIATVWGGQDPTAAKACALSLPAGKGREMAIIGLVQGMARSEPTATLDRVKALPEEMRPKYTYEEVSRVWSESEPHSSSKQALAMPKGEDRWNSLAAVTSSWADKDPAAAMAAAVKMPVGGMRTNVFGAILSKASKLGEAEASRLLEVIPEWADRTAAMRAAEYFEEDNK